MKRIRRRAAVLSVVLVFFLACNGVLLFRYAGNASSWAAHRANPDAYADGRPKNPGTVTMADGTVIYGPDGYTPDAALRQATLHALGDAGGNIMTGVRVLQGGALVGYSPIGGLHSYTGKGGQVRLTLDTATTRAAWDALGGYNGTIGVYNYQTGAVLCMVSKPSMDPLNPPQQPPDGVYLNRLYSGLYTPGSVFKVVTAAAALEQIADIETRSWLCEGGATIGGEWVACTGYHGEVGLERAFAVSCNAAFGHMAVELGAETLSEYADKLGVTQSYTVDGAATAKGSVKLAGASENDLAWAGIGQHNDLINPMQYLMLMGAIATDGNAVMPHFIGSVKTPEGIPSLLRVGIPRAGRMLQSETAQQLQQLMRGAVETEYGDWLFPGLDFCGKTGTAQLDNQAAHSLFVGFSQNPETPLAIVVVMEHAGSGAQGALPTASQVLQQAVLALDNTD